MELLRTTLGKAFKDANKKKDHIMKFTFTPEK